MNNKIKGEGSFKHVSERRSLSVPAPDKEELWKGYVERQAGELAQEIIDLGKTGYVIRKVELTIFAVAVSVPAESQPVAEKAL